MVRVNLEVDEATKRRWDEHADESWGGNLSMMIRRAGEKAPEAAGRATDLDPVLDRIGDLEDELRLLRSQVEEAGRAEDLDRVAGRLSEWLPAGEPGSGGWHDLLVEIRTGNVPERLPTEDEAAAERAWSGSPGALADAAGYPPDVAEEALEMLEREVPSVRSCEYKGTPRYYRMGVADARRD